jgi:hypothetical protein
MAHGSIQYKVIIMGQSRNEEILENILGETDILADPRSRNESLLLQIYEQLQDSKDLVATYENGTVTVKLR